MSFTWVPIYEELATALMAYEARQDELVQLITELNDAGFRALPVVDKTATGDATLTAIDPFSFFATFNRGQTDENRRAVLRRLKLHFGLSAGVPDDFHGIPVADKRASWFFHFSKSRQSDEIPTLWALARQAVTGGRNSIDPVTFDRCLRIKTVKAGKMSMGLFWLRPREFMPLDRRSMALLRSREVEVPDAVDSWVAYSSLLRAATAMLGDDFPRLSLEAYMRETPSGTAPVAPEPTERKPRWWLFQCNADKYDLDGALRAWTRTHWRVTRYVDDVAVGDRVFLWVSGKSGGLRAIATVDTPVSFVAENEDDPFIRDPEALNVPMKRVGIQIDDCSRLVPRDAVRTAAGLENFVFFRAPQQTNYPVTSEEANVLFALYAGGSSEPTAAAPARPPAHPLNLILYGPPGTGKTYTMRAMRDDFAVAYGTPKVDGRRDLVPSRAAGAPNNQFFVTFHPSFSYEDFIEGIHPESDEDGGPVRYPLRAGVFKQACERAVQLAGFERGLADFCLLPEAERKRWLVGAPPAVLFIDEINRGNVARVFGELITLIEPDKRLGAENEIIVTLPGSRQRFGVPSNLWIICTMNTADRSVVALDVALRRRFAFRECPPRPELLDGILVDGLDLRRLLQTINRRLLVLRDRDHLIGHAFFLSLKPSPTLDGLRTVFREAVLPLLFEYFHEDLGRVGLVLGPQWVRRASGNDIFAKGFEHDQREDLADRTVWEINDVNELPIEAFRSIDG